MWKAILAGFACLGLFAPRAVAQPSFPPVAEYCSSTAAFGQEFGGTSVERPGRVTNGNGSRRSFAPRSDFAPFTSFEVGFTPSSRRLHSAHGSTLVAEREDARAIFDALVAALTSDERFQDHEIAEPDVSPSGAVWRTAKFYAGDARQDAQQPTGFRVVIYFWERVSAESTITMDCVDAATYRLAERESFAD